MNKRGIDVNKVDSKGNTALHNLLDACVKWIEEVSPKEQEESSESQQILECLQRLLAHGGVDTEV